MKNEKADETLLVPEKKILESCTNLQWRGEFIHNFLSELKIYRFLSFEWLDMFA